MSIRISPELGKELKVKYRRCSADFGPLGDVHEQFPFKLIYAVKSCEFMPITGGDFVLDFLNVGEYGIYDWREPHSGRPKVYIRLNDPNNVWLGFDYDSDSRGFGGAFRSDSDIWER